MIPAAYYFSMKGKVRTSSKWWFIIQRHTLTNSYGFLQVANQKYWLNLRELAPKLALKQNTKKAQKSALLGDDLSQKSVPELISAGFEEDSSSDESEETEMEDNDADMEEDEEIESGEDDSGSENNDFDMDEDDSDSEEEVRHRGRISFVPKGKIEGVSMSAQHQEFRQKLLEKINMARKGRKVAPVDAEGNILVEDTPHSKRRAAKEKKKAKSGEPEMSRRQVKNLKKRQRKEEALKAMPKVPQDDPYALDDSDTDQKPAMKKKKVVEENLDFGKMRFEDGHAKSHYERMQEKGLSKEKQLAKLQREKEYEEKLQGTEAGEKLKEEKAWSKTFKRLEGEKVKDRADLLKKAIKKEESSRKKSTKEWKERTAAVKTSQDEKAKKRAANIKERLEIHKLKKVGKKAPKKKK